MPKLILLKTNIYGSNLRETKFFNASSLIISSSPSKMQSSLSACLHTCAPSHILHTPERHQGFSPDSERVLSLENADNLVTYFILSTMHHNL